MLRSLIPEAALYPIMPLIATCLKGKNISLAGQSGLNIILFMLPAKRFRLLLLLGPALIAFPLYATIWDGARERAVAERLAEDLESGKVIWLTTNNQHEFPVIYTRPNTIWNPEIDRGAVILLHGMGGHPDWPIVISPLRKLFNQASWTTLSIQLPVLSAETALPEYGKTVNEAAARTGRAVEYLHDRGYRTIVLLGYGFGAATAAWYLANSGENHVCAFAGISMHARKFLNPQLDLLDSLGNLRVPILDIFGSRDQKVIVQMADDRRLAARKNGNHNFTQISLEDADQSYTDMEQALFDSIIGWLDGQQLEIQDCYKNQDEKPETEEQESNDMARILLDKGRLKGQ